VTLVTVMFMTMIHFIHSQIQTLRMYKRVRLRPILFDGYLRLFLFLHGTIIGQLITSPLLLRLLYSH